MKLSELFKTPFKLKGGATLNLRGFSKRIVDKEIGGGGDSESISPAYFAPTFIYKNNSPEEVESIDLILSDVNKKVEKVNIDDFIKKIENNDTEQNLMYECIIEFNDKFFSIGTRWRAKLYNIQPDGLENFRPNRLEHATMGSGSTKASIAQKTPTLEYNNVYGGSINTEGIISLNEDNLVKLVYTPDGQTVITGSDEAWRGIYFSHQLIKLNESDNTIIFPCFWIDGVAAAQDTEYNKSKYVKLAAFELILIPDEPTLDPISGGNVG